MPTVIDLHVHTTRGSSDSSLTPEAMVIEAKRIGLQAICITEHNTLWDKAKFREFAYKHDMLLIRGVEVDTDMGHVLAFGLDEYISGISKIQELRRIILEIGGAMITAHPFRGLLDKRPNSWPLLYESSQNLPNDVDQAISHPVFGFVDAVEVANGSTVDAENNFAYRVSKKLRLAGTGGSDAHSTHGLGRCTTFFQKNIRSEKEFVEALKMGSFYASYGLRMGKVRPFKS